MHLDDTSAGAVLRSLGDDPPGPSTVDITRAVTEGRRRRRVRRLAGYTSASAATALVIVAVWAVAGTRGDRTAPPSATGASGSAHASAAVSAPPSALPSPPPSSNIPRVPEEPPTSPTKCTISQLPMPDGRKQALVTAMDPTGRYIAGRTYPSGSGDYHVVVWDRRKPTIVTMPGEDQSIEDINSSGVGVGTSYTDGSTTAWLLRNGKITKLPGGDGSEAPAINEAGVAAGTHQGQPVIWRSLDAPPTKLPVPSGVLQTRIMSIDEDGTVLGILSDGSRADRPYIWLPNGVGQQLPSLKAQMVYDINNGRITGLSGLGPNGDGIVFDLHSGEARTIDKFAGRPDAINRHGWLVGIDPQGRGLLLAGDRPVVLPDVQFHIANELHNIPVAISDDGKTISGQSDTKDDIIHAVVWTCT